jgi:hypothetical protein
MAKRQQTFSWLFIAALAAVAVWVSKTLKGNPSAPFTGVTNQRGMYGYDQFGNPIDPTTGQPLGGL